jgi:hypothetical protein
VAALVDLEQGSSRSSGDRVQRLRALGEVASTSSVGDGRGAGAQCRQVLAQGVEQAVVEGLFPRQGAALAGQGLVLERFSSG